MEAGGSTGVRLTRDGPVWEGTFDGLGSVRVRPDGDLEVAVQGADDLDPIEVEQRAAALRWGWGEPLAWARRGCSITVGTAVVAPGRRGSLVVRGAAHDAPIVVAGLAGRGWQVLADRVVPLRLSDDVAEVQPTDAPVLLARRRVEAMGLSGSAVRADTDAVAIEVPRWSAPEPLLGVVEVLMRRGGLPPLEVLEGHERFEMASRLVAIGALEADGEALAPSECMARDLRLAALELARAHLDADDSEDVLDAIESWWFGGAGGAGGAGAAGEGAS